MLAVVCEARTRDVSSFGKLANYMEFGSGQSMQIDTTTGEVLARGEMFYSEAILEPRHAIAEMEAVALQNGRVADPIFHYILAWQEGEQPTREQWETAVMRTQEAMGMGDHQCVAALHKDGTTWHVHVMANRVNPDSYRAADLWKCHERLDVAIREVEHVQGWQESHGLARWQDDRAVLLTKEEKKTIREAREARQDVPEGVAAKVETYRDAESFAAWVKGEPAQALDAVMKRQNATWQDVHKELARFGLTLNRTENGKLAGFTISVRDEHGTEIHAKASESFRKHFAGKKAREATDTKLGTWEAPTPTTAPVNLGEKPSPIVPEELKAATYTTGRTRRDPAERADRKAERDRARTMLKTEYQNYRLDWKRDEQLRRAAEGKQLKSAMTGIADRRRERVAHVRRQKLPKELRQVALSVIAVEAIQARAIVRADQAQERQARRVQDYRAFVEERAAEGRPDALAQLRGFRYAEQRRPSEPEGVTGAGTGRYDPAGPRGFTQRQPAELSLSWNVDRKRGHVIYSLAGRQAFVDEGRNVRMAKREGGKHDADQVRIAMQLAVQKFGPAIKLTGSDAFRRQAIEVSVASGIRVQFSAGPDETYRQQLVAAREASRAHQTGRNAPARPSPAQGQRPPVSRIPPRFARGRSRSLVELGELATDGGPIARPSAPITPAHAPASPPATVTPGATAHDARNDGRGPDQRPDRAGTDTGRRAAGAELGSSAGHKRHAKPDASRVGNQPPPEAKNRLRDVSELGVVHHAPGGEVLLPRDVPGHVEQQGTDPVHGLRRPLHREVEPSVSVAATPARVPAAVDPLAPYRAAVTRAEGKSVLAVEIAQAQLTVAQEYHAAGENLRHAAAAILATGEQRVMDRLRDVPAPTPAGLLIPAAPIEPPAVAVSAEDRKRGDVLATQAVREFRGLAAKRKGKMSGYKDGQDDWSGLPGELRERIERFNTLTKDGQDGELAKMQQTLADEYARDPAAAGRDRKTRTIDKGRSR
jgi:hypothetical protein